MISSGFSRFVFVCCLVSGVALLAGCGGPAAPPAAEKPAETPAPAPVAADAVEPPPQGDIILDPAGIQLVGSNSTTNYTFDASATSLWIPTAWTGAIQTVTLNTGGPAAVSTGGTITFPSGAKLSVAKNADQAATWQCALPGGTFSGCVTTTTTVLPNQFNPGTAGTTSVQLAGSNQVSVSGTWSLTIH